MELAVEAAVAVTNGVEKLANGMVETAAVVGDVETVSTVDEVDTADEMEYTVVDTVGPSGCLSLPILLPPYSANQTLTTPVASGYRARP